MPHGRDPARLTQVKEGRTWQIGDSSVVAWIAAGTVTGLTITSAIPPVFDDFATIVIPDGGRGSAQHDQLVIALLSKHSPNQPWWLGYLDTGSDDVIFPDAAPTRLYANWSYVLIEAGPEQALAWRSHAPGWNRSLPELLFPADHSWLLSTLWDDDWRCLGGPASLIEALQQEPQLDVRRVSIDEDATPPGHVAR
jgi:hypothetical protein